MDPVITNESKGNGRHERGLGCGYGTINTIDVSALLNAPLASATQVTAFSGTPVVRMGSTGVFSSIAPGTPVTLTAPLNLDEPEQSGSMLLSVGGFTVDVTGRMTVTQTPHMLEVSGTGLLNANGMNQVPGTFGFTAAPDSGTTLGLLGIGIVGIVALRRRVRNNLITT
jgi:hypothetical protein